MKTLSSTSHAAVNQILNLMLSNVQEILEDQFIGMYLFGSLANGDFDEYSDIDVLVVTEGEISKSAFSALLELHKKINQLDSPWALQIEASYIPRKALRRFDPTDNSHPHMDRGNDEVLHMMPHESDWIVQRHILRERGIVITGPALQELIDPVSQDELRRAVVNVLPLWTRSILEDPSLIKRRGYQSYCVLTLCRMLYTLEHGGVLSKPRAATWAMKNLDPRWKPLIERALIGRESSEMDANPEEIQETAEMMRYTLRQSHPTPYPEVNEVLNLLRSKVKRILGEQFIGLYLYGSLSSGDFDLESSDIDFLVVTRDTLSDSTISRLEGSHKEIWATGLKWTSKLEGAYVPRETIRRHDPNGTAVPGVNEGRFYVARLGSDWIIQRYVLREMGLVVEGPDPKTLIDPVSGDDIRSSVLGILQEWWLPMLQDSSWLREHGSVYHAFAVITMCRALHALEHGTIVSKPKAIVWARDRLDDPWRQLIDKAVPAARHEAGPGFLEESLSFIGFVREQTMPGEKTASRKGDGHAQSPS
jgi:predicted nucleotidyltransferase